MTRVQTRRFLIPLTTTALFAGLCAAPTAMGADTSEAYDTIQLQARTNLLVNDNGWNLPPGSSFNSVTPDINEAAEVAFRVQYVAAEGMPSSGAPGVWFGGDGAGSIVHRGTEAQSIPNEPSLNESGDIAFTLGDGGVDNRLYLYDGSSGVAGQVSTSPVVPSSYSSPALDEEGDITFQGTFGSGRGLAVVEDGEGRFYVQDSSLDPESPYGFLYTPRGNDAGQIATKVGLVSDISNDVEIRLFNPDGTSDLLLASDSVDPDSAYRKFDNSVALSDNGTVAAIATRASDSVKVVLLIQGTTVTEVAAVGQDGLTSLEFFSPDVNDAGQVVFRGKDAAGQAVFLADGDGLTRVVGVGDEVTTDLGVAQVGQHDASPVFGGAPRINNSGDVSFTAGARCRRAVTGSVAPEPVGPESVERWSGTNRFDTAANAALEVYPDGADVVYVATGRAFPDALTATAPAGNEDGPVLLTESDRLPLDTIRALEALAPGDIVLVGGSGSVSDSVQTQLEGYTDGAVTRLSGTDRYATAAKLSERFTSPDTVYVATGLDYPDALAAGARAGAEGAPVLLVRQDGIPGSTRQALTSLSPGNIVLVGGTGSVSEDVRTALGEFTDGTVTRVSGADRYDTAVALSQSLTSSEFGFVATGQDWPDALGAAALAGHLNSPVLLTRATALPGVTTGELERLEPPHLRVVGGSAVVQDGVLQALTALDYTDGPPPCPAAAPGPGASWPRLDHRPPGRAPTSTGWADTWASTSALTSRARWLGSSWRGPTNSTP